MEDKMKKLMAAAALAVLLAGAGAPCRANEGKAERMGKTIDEKIEHMKRDLKLDAEQERRVRQILEEKAAKVKEFSEDAAKRIRAALTPEQQTKYDKMKHDMAH
jgi:hypothetical protein